MKDKIKVITTHIKDKDGKEHKFYIDIEKYELNLDYNNYLEYILFKYPLWLLEQYRTKRIPNREGEEDSFENWKLKGKPKPSLFNYGTLIDNDFKDIKKLLGMI